MTYKLYFMFSCTLRLSAVHLELFHVELQSGLCCVFLMRISYSLEGNFHNMEKYSMLHTPKNIRVFWQL